MKKCSTCGKEKKLSEFSKKLNYTQPSCKPCSYKNLNDYLRTKKGLATVIYNSQKFRSIRRNHPMPEYSLEELRSWILSRKNFEKLYNNWVNSGYNTGLKPSVDRIDDNIHYTLDNIQLITWKENEDKSNEDMRNGILKHGNNPQKKVIITFVDTGKEKEFVSIRDAERKTGLNRKGIIDRCKGRIKNTGNYTCRYSE